VHGALIDADLLANVYLAMTGGQTALLLEPEPEPVSRGESLHAVALRSDLNLVVVRASGEEILAHQAFLKRIQEAGGCLWRE
jgi:DNA polymerase-3 subunit epsilon